MVDDDDLKSGGLGLRKRVICHCTAIDGHDQTAAPCADADKGLTRRAITLHQPVGDVITRIKTQHTQQADEQRRTGRAIDVIVPIDGDLFARLDRLRQTQCSMLHILEYRWVGHEVANGRVTVSFDIVPVNAARHKQLGHQIVRFEIRITPIGATAAPMPGLLKNGTFNVEYGLHPASLWRTSGASKHRCGNC